jgi:putative transposase
VSRNVATDPVARARFRMVEVAQKEGVSAAARQFGVSQPTVYKVLERFATEGAQGLLNRPRGGQGAMAPQIVEAIVLYKLDNVDRSTRKVQDLVWREQGVSVSRQTVWRVLSERGLARIVDPTPIQPFERPQPNDLWQIDLMENEATPFGKVHLTAVLDDRSRYLLAGRFSERRSEEVVLSVLAEALERRGRLGAILSDRGKQFRAQESLQGPQVTYQFILDLLGIRAVYARPYHPQTKGKIEKLFQFVQRDFLTEWRFKVGSLDELNAAFAEWTQWYDREHSRSSLGGKPAAARDPGVGGALRRSEVQGPGALHRGSRVAAHHRR